MRFWLLAFLLLTVANVHAQSKHNSTDILKILDERLGHELHYSSFYNAAYKAKNIRAISKTIVIPKRYFIKDSSNYSNGLVRSSFNIITKAGDDKQDSGKSKTIFLYRDQTVVKISDVKDTTVYTYSDSVLIQKESIVLGRKYKESFVYDDSLKLRYILTEFGERKDTTWLILYESILHENRGNWFQVTMQPFKIKGRSHEWCRITLDENYNKIEESEGTEGNGCDLSFSHEYSNERYKTAIINTSCMTEGKIVKYNEVREYEYNGNDLVLIRTKFQDENRQRCEWFQNQLPIKSCGCDQDPNDVSSGWYYQYYYE